MPTDQLQPIGPRDALELYVDDCKGELSPETVQAKEYRLGFFIRWCEGKDAEEERIANMNELTGRDILSYKNWRKDGIENVTLKTQMSELRTFLRFCVTIDAVHESMVEKVNVPSLDKGENVRETFMDEDKATNILSFLEQYHYASRSHVLLLLLWQTGARMSGVHSLDVDDVDSENARIEIHHRPDEGTRLKNGDDGERIVTVPPSTIEVIEDYIEVKRYDVTDDHGRRPLLTTENGRADKRHLSKYIYKWTCPCQYNQPCPADKDPLSCEYTGSLQGAVKCPHNTRPHDIRRGAITVNLRKDVPERAISDRMDVGVDTLDRHYDKREPEQKAEQRREWFAGE